MASSCGLVEVDMRSDTVTKPSAAMYQAMITAPVGDDVMKEDPTVLALEARCAKLFNKEDALFVPTGTMGNLTSVMVHCMERGAEVIVGKRSHMFLFEGGGLAQLGGIHPNKIRQSEEDGALDLEEIKENIRDTTDDHMPRTKVICLENTHNRCGGLILPISYFKEVRQLADENNLLVHLDGARILHACVAQGVEPTAYTNLVDSVSMCFSKGLGAPFGSIIAGSKEFCMRASKIRKALGGGMRQAGVMAAAALYALENNIDRLREDHDNAKTMAEVIAKHGGSVAHIDLRRVHTNIGFIKMMKPDAIDAVQFAERMTKVTQEEEKALGQKTSVKMSIFGNDVRFVCHLDVSREHTALAARKVEYVLREMSQY